MYEKGQHYNLEDTLFIQMVKSSFLFVLMELLQRYSWDVHFYHEVKYSNVFNKANLKDFIAVTGLIILLKLDSNRRFCSPCDLDIWWMTSKNYRAPLLHYIKLFASSQTARWIQTGVTVRKRSSQVKIGESLSLVTLKFDGWYWKTKGNLFYATLSFVHHFKPLGEFKLELQSGNAQFGSKSTNFCPVWPRNLMDDLEKQ